MKEGTLHTINDSIIDESLIEESILEDQLDNKKERSKLKIFSKIF
jgi:hypothetical protein